MSNLLTPLDLETCFNVIRQQCLDDPMYMWSWHCNFALPIMDATMADHEKANQAAALIMAQVFNVDSTTSPYYCYNKSLAQIGYEARLEAEASGKPYDAYRVLKQDDPVARTSVSEFLRADASGSEQATMADDTKQMEGQEHD